MATPVTECGDHAQVQRQRAANRVAAGLIPECPSGPTEDANLLPNPPTTVGGNLEPPRIPLNPSIHPDGPQGLVMDATEHLKTHCRMSLLHHPQAILPTCPTSWTGQQERAPSPPKHRSKLTAFQNKKLGSIPRRSLKERRNEAWWCAAKVEVWVNHAQIIVRPV